MGTINFVTVDVFTSEKYAGNQLAIVEISPTGLSQDQKQTIAREFNYSETTFVHPQSDPSRNEWTVDIFTPDEELPWAGHPTIGTAVYLLKTRANQDATTVTGVFNLKAGRADLEYDVARGTAHARIPQNLHIHQAVYSSTELMRLQPKIAHLPEESPIVSIVTGLTFVLCELESQDDLTFVNTTPYPIQARLDKGKDESFVGCYFYNQFPADENGVIQLHTRMIESSVGEDAATGSAACTLACYLSIQQRRTGTTRYRIVQGVHMGRRSEIGVDVKMAADGKIDTVFLSGSAVQVMEGKLSP